MENKANW